MEYTEKEHAKRLLEMLDMEDTCSLCPACKSNGYNPKLSPPAGYRTAICPVCTKFVVVDKNVFRGPCPCWQLGEKEAIKRTWLALEEKGYI